MFYTQHYDQKLEEAKARKMGEVMPIGVIVRGEDPVASLRRVKTLGIPTCQMYALPDEWRSERNIEKIKNVISETGVRITCLFCHFEGESYADIPTIKKTVGLLNADTRTERIEKTLTFSDFAKKLNIPALAAHIGFIPEDEDDPNYNELIKAMQKICDYCNDNGQKFALETGQESPETLSIFIEDVNRLNIGINFDPANMLLYDKGDPIKALDVLGKYVIGVHCKDGKRPERRNELGEELPLGEGEVGIEQFINKLKEIGYTGPLTIEREISGKQQTKDILKAKKLLEIG